MDFSRLFFPWKTQQESGSPPSSSSSGLTASTQRGAASSGLESFTPYGAPSSSLPAQGLLGLSSKATEQNGKAQRGSESHKSQQEASVSTGLPSSAKPPSAASGSHMPAGKASASHDSLLTLVSPSTASGASSTAATKVALPGHGGGVLPRENWMQDRDSPHCYGCELQFTTWNRRHHCRRCGRIFCGKCTQKSIPEAFLRSQARAPNQDTGEKVRVCDQCYSDALNLPRKGWGRGEGGQARPRGVEEQGFVQPGTLGERREGGLRSVV